jgi:hypothetical protein
MNVVCVHVETLNDDDVDAPVHGEVLQVVDGTQADNGMGTVDTRDVVLVGDVLE